MQLDMENKPKRRGREEARQEEYSFRKKKAQPIGLITVTNKSCSPRTGYMPLLQDQIIWALLVQAA